NVIESVLMRYSYGLSVCISSQVGCSMGCRFCASTIGGRIRNLTA
ncbi:MAG TPA: 23S rRNA (adenine(2503)-C(2))-methyltransferase RlmN, partial [Lachnospiraceae bacterium]|nr:23S rRNA (adenine(2503)-C(2))-methyltransferase RlmN [Lachnospiraceae bacterium]